MTEEQLAAVRLYTSREAVEKLGLKPTWLKRWITAERVPHVRAGAERGVGFTAAHVLEIGRMLPDLLGGQRGASMAGEAQVRAAVVDQSASSATAKLPDDREPRAGAAAEPSVVDIASWSQLRAHRPRPRST
jgi:hypothetical protein